MIERLRQLEYSDSKYKRCVHFILSKCWQLARCIADARLRSEAISKKLYVERYHQKWTYTENDRYPELFAACSLYFNTRPECNILSFGCSTGEEVASLRKYMPQAHITGVEINWWCLRQCRKKIQDEKVALYHRFSDDFARSGPFDAIFCMAVFQNPDNRNAADNRVATHYIFDRFENEILFLDRKLKPGGLFIIDHSDFSFSDTSCSAHYIPLNIECNGICYDRPLYDRQNKKIAEEQNVFRVFVKKE